MEQPCLTRPDPASTRLVRTDSLPHNNNNHNGHRSHYDHYSRYNHIIPAAYRPYSPPNSASGSSSSSSSSSSRSVTSTRTGSSAGPTVSVSVEAAAAAAAAAATAAASAGRKEVVLEHKLDRIIAQFEHLVARLARPDRPPPPPQHRRHLRHRPPPKYQHSKPLPKIVEPVTTAPTRTTAAAAAAAAAAGPARLAHLAAVRERVMWPDTPSMFSAAATNADNADGASIIGQQFGPGEPAHGAAVAVAGASYSSSSSSSSSSSPPKPSTALSSASVSASSTSPPPPPPPVAADWTAWVSLVLYRQGGKPAGTVAHDLQSIALAVPAHLVPPAVVMQTVRAKLAECLLPPAPGPEPGPVVSWKELAEYVHRLPDAIQIAAGAGPSATGASVEDWMGLDRRDVAGPPQWHPDRRGREFP